jgi:hypothetical protein
MFRAGAALREIMPTADMVDNSLQNIMAVRVNETGSTLHTKALALEQGSLKVLLVSLDVINVDRHCPALQQAIAAATGFDVDHIVICATHTHSSPRLGPLDPPHPFLDFVLARSVEAAREAVASLQPAQVGWENVQVIGASFNTRLPFGAGVKYARDFREGLAGGRPIDPRLTVVRIDDVQSRPIAGWIRFAAHPACVIFDTPISAEYPGYMTDRLRETVTRGTPVIFGYGSSGDVNCLPMFGTEDDSRRLGLRLAELAGPVFESIKTQPLQKLAWHSGEAELPLDQPPTIEILDREIAEIEAFIRDLDNDPTLEWVIGINVGKSWPVDKKKRHVQPLLGWARLAKEAVLRGKKFPTTWKVPLSTLLLDDLGLVFYGGEVLTQIGLMVAARSPLRETLLVTLGNGGDAYIGLAEDRRRAGYETYTVTRGPQLNEDYRPLPYAPEAGELLVEACLASITAAKP